VSPRSYRLLFLLLPSRFRDEYGQELGEVVEDRWRVVQERGGIASKMRSWVRETVALTRLALRLRLGLEPDGAPPRGARRKTTKRGWEMNGWGSDVRQAARSLFKQPGFTVVTVLTLGLGIGASTAIFSAVHAVLFRDLAYTDADRIVAVFHTDTETRAVRTGASAANMRDLDESSDRLSGAAVAEPWSLDLFREDRAESLRTWSVSSGFFDILGADLELGRAFLPEEYVEGNDRVVVLGHRGWTQYFGGDPSIVGRVFTLDNEPYTVIGVLPSEFALPDEAAAWIPRPPKSGDAPSRAADYMFGVARLASGATLADAQAEVDRLALALAESFPRTNAGVGMRLVPLREHLFGDVSTPLYVLLSAVGFVLLIACANVAGLMLARGAKREREYALRSAIGAGRGRLVAHVATESFILATLGCALGVGLTYLGVRVIQGLGPDHLPRIDELRVDGAVLTFSVVAAGLSAFLSGLAPAFKLSRPDLRGALSDGSHGSRGGRKGNRLRNRLVVLEVAAALVLLIGAGLLTKIFTILVNEELGFDPTDRVVIQFFANGYEEEELRQFVDQTIENMEAIPGVRAVAITSSVPGATDRTISSIEIDVPMRIEGLAPPPEGQEPITFISQVSASRFETMDISMVAGRGFDDGDRAETPPVVIVNEALVRRHLGYEDAVGQRIGVPWGADEDVWKWHEIVGVVRDVRPLGFESEPHPEVYFPFTQMGTTSLTFMLASDTDAGPLVAQASQAIWDVMPTQTLWGATTLETLLGDWLKERRFNLVLLSSFAIIALLLSAVGIYGLISFSMQQRVGELGIRRALGGRTLDVLGMVLKEGVALAAAGVLLGVAGALVLTRFLAGMLFGVEPTDWPTFGLLALAVLTVSSLATLVPAIRATRVDPMEALRD